MSIFLRSSGLLAMIFAWLFVVVPALKFGIDGKRQTISSATKNNGVRIIVSIGLTLGSLFQFLFLRYLLFRFNLSFFNMGGMMYSSAIVATVLVAIFTEHRFVNIHSFFVKYYFCIFPISLLLVMSNTINEHQNLFAFSCLIVFLYFGGIWWTIKKFGISAKVEQWAFFVLSVWTMVLTLV